MQKKRNAAQPFTNAHKLTTATNILLREFQVSTRSTLGEALVAKLLKTCSARGGVAAEGGHLMGQKMNKKLKNFQRLSHRVSRSLFYFIVKVGFWMRQKSSPNEEPHKKNRCTPYRGMRLTPSVTRSMRPVPTLNRSIRQTPILNRSMRPAP